MKGKKVIYIVFAVIISLIGFRLVKVAISKKGVTETIIKFPVDVLTIVPSDYDETLDITGNIIAENQTEVPAKISGKIIKYLFEEGDWVEKGQNVVTVDRDEIGVEFMEAVLESPISGWLIKKYFDTGAHVNPGIPLFQVADYRRVKLVASVPETDLSKVKRGAQARASIDAWPNSEFGGYVKSVSPAVDQISRTVKVEISLNNTGLKLRPGMFGRAEVLVIKHKKAVVIPTAAILEAGGFPKSFVVVGGRAAAREVKITAQANDLSLIGSGLNFGDTVIVAGQYTVVDGAPVEIVGGK